MPIYESEELTIEQLHKVRRRNICQECGGRLSLFLDPDTKKAFIACKDYFRTHHEGIEREASQYEQRGMGALNIETRREIMGKEIGHERTKALEKYQHTAVMTRDVAVEIVETLWKDAPPVEKLKAIMLCQQYNLNPLMKHLYLLPFNKKDATGKVIGKDWVMVHGIGATRLMAHRRHNFTYLDLTPRVATKDELERILGDNINVNLIYFITKIKDLKTGAEAFGLGTWPKNINVYGADKGNSPSNMASIRSERQAIDRLYPGEMPPGGEIADERFMDEPVIEGEGRVVDEQTGEIIEATPGATPPIEKDDHPPQIDLLKLEFKNQGEFYAACLKNLKVNRSQVDKETPEYEKNNPQQRKQAWGILVSLYRKPPEPENLGAERPLHDNPDDSN